MTFAVHGGYLSLSVTSVKLTSRKLNRKLTFNLLTMIDDLFVLVTMKLLFLNMGEKNREIQMLIGSDIFIKMFSFQSKKFYEVGSLRLK